MPSAERVSLLKANTSRPGRSLRAYWFKGPDTPTVAQQPYGSGHASMPIVPRTAGQLGTVRTPIDRWLPPVPMRRWTSTLYAP